MSRARLRRASLASAAALAITGGVAPRAFAQDPADLPAPQSTVPGASPGLEQAQRRAFWVSGRTRPFVAATLEAGILYFRPQIQVGYGRPHWKWFGLEAFGSASPGGGAEYVGAKLAIPQFEVRGGARYVFPANRHFLQPQRSYTRDETEYQVLPRSRYVSLEAEAVGSVPVGTGSFFAVVSGYRLSAIPEGYYVFEESLRIVVDPEWMWRIRGGYFQGISSGVSGDDTLKVGVAGEVIGNPGRQHHVVRAGPIVAVSLTHHLEAIGSALFVVASRDSLGFFGTEIGQLGLRYRWASGDRWPRFP